MGSGELKVTERFLGVIWDFGALEDLKFSPVFLF